MGPTSKEKKIKVKKLKEANEGITDRMLLKFLFFFSFHFFSSFSPFLDSRVFNRQNSSK